MEIWPPAMPSSARGVSVHLEKKKVPNRGVGMALGASFSLKRKTRPYSTRSYISAAPSRLLMKLLELFVPLANQSCNAMVGNLLPPEDSNPWL